MFFIKIKHIAGVDKSPKCMFFIIAVLACPDADSKSQSRVQSPRSHPISSLSKASLKFSFWKIGVRPKFQQPEGRLKLDWQTQPRPPLCFSMPHPPPPLHVKVAISVCAAVTSSRARKWLDCHCLLLHGDGVANHSRVLLKDSNKMRSRKKSANEK